MIEDTPRPEYLFELSNPNLWGDYGDILMGGQLFDFGDTVPNIRRTGPFVPPIAKGGGYSVTDEFRLAMDASGLRGLCFGPLQKSKIVKLDWHEWNRAARLEDWQYPEENEPQNYLKRLPHDPALALVMPKLWQLIPPRVCSFVSNTPVGTQLISWSASQIADLDFVRSRSRAIFVTERAKHWLELHAPEWVAFDPIQVVD